MKNVKKLERGGHHPVLRAQEQRRLVLAVHGGIHGGLGAGAHERRDAGPPLLHAVPPVVPAVEGEAPGMFCLPVRRGCFIPRFCCCCCRACSLVVGVVLVSIGRGRFEERRFLAADAALSFASSLLRVRRLFPPLA